MLIFDLEVNQRTKRIDDIGAITTSNKKFRNKDINEFKKFIDKTRPTYYAGHNIVLFDYQFLNKELKEYIKADNIVDTLYLSALLYPRKPYHNLVKDDKLTNNYINNPYNDAIKAKDLFYDSLNTFNNLEKDLKDIYYHLLKDKTGFKAFFKYINYMPKNNDLSLLITNRFNNDICINKNIEAIINKYPLELAYALSYINTKDVSNSLIPPWILMNYSKVENIYTYLRNTPCNKNSCSFCNKNLLATSALQKYFNYPSFRKFNGISLQEDAVNSAIKGESLIGVFPTGGGKSLAFQLPALIAGETISGLTVVISPLQSLMKDQVDNLIKRNINNVAYINGLLNPIERKDTINRVLDGTINILYIAPESLRSRTIERLLLKRQIVRFVIDEAHCFSTWGHDFRVDYLYIGDFINNLINKKNESTNIPVSCFTATAKQDVIKDIKDYFKDKLNIDMNLFKTNLQRTNLSYQVIKVGIEDNERYLMLRNILEGNDLPTIIYASRTKIIDNLFKRLLRDNFLVSKFHGKMDNDQKINNQNDFMEGKTKIMVATNAFGMGVDKDDVGVVIHYNISSSLEDYVQEAGRAGRDEALKANCYILYNENDLNAHFDLLRQSKISQKEISQVWSGIKRGTKTRNEFTKTTLEIAKLTRWDTELYDLDTRIKTAVLALEDTKYIKRGMNSPRIYATSLLVKNIQEAIKKIRNSKLYTNKDDIENSKRIIASLISNKRRSWDNELASARVDYLADRLGLDKKVIINNINLLREAKLISDDSDLFAKINETTVLQTLITNINRYNEFVNYLINSFTMSRSSYNLKLLNSEFNSENYQPNIKYLRIALNYLNNSKQIKLEKDYYDNFYANLLKDKETTIKKLNRYFTIGKFLIEYLFNKYHKDNTLNTKSLIDFSLLEIKEAYLKSLGLIKDYLSTEEIENIILMIQRLEILDFEGGFLVSYSPLTIKRLEEDNKARYLMEDYNKLKNHYENKYQQIHIVGTYAKLMNEDKLKAHAFVSDYFNLKYKDFIDKYYPGKLKQELDLKMSRKRHKKLFGMLTSEQSVVISDNKNNLIGVAAGPGSGKTTLLVHKLASIIYNEDIRREQLLMLTFSRSAALEFRQRLKELIGNAANYIEITTFHSYAFDIVGKLGSLEMSDNVVREALTLIKNNEADSFKVTKMMLVIDEAQDISLDEYNLIKELIKYNDNLRVLAVGDDDQNIYEFRGSNSKYLKEFTKDIKYELTKNFRSMNNIVDFSNQLISKNKMRIKTNLIKSFTDKNGVINITYYTKANLITPLINNLLNNINTGITAIITRTNEEALLVSGLLNEKGITNRLIQTISNIKAFNIYELRWFYNKIEKSQLVKIDMKTWYEAITTFESKFNESKNIEDCLKVLNTFITNYSNPYLTDLYQYLIELEMSHYDNNDKIIVTNLHKVKGMEFDNVYLLYEYSNKLSAEDIRVLYVGITRSKKTLNIHTTNKIFNSLKSANTNYLVNNNNYNEPQVIDMLFDHSCVNLGYFEYVKNNVMKVNNGNELTLKDNILYSNNNRVGKLSNKGMNLYEDRISKNYELEQIEASNLVYWYNSEKEKEVLLILPKLSFRKKK